VSQRREELRLQDSFERDVKNSQRSTDVTISGLSSEQPQSCNAFKAAAAAAAAGCSSCRQDDTTACSHLISSASGAWKHARRIDLMVRWSPEKSRRVASQRRRP